MGVVTEIRENRGMVEVLVDNATLARVRKAHFDRCPLSKGEEIDAPAYIDRLAAVQFPDGYEAALSSLDASAKSAMELSRSLRRRGYVQPVVEAVVARLEENGLIDDAGYARRMAELQSARPVGVYAFRRRLRAKGISDEDAEEALGAFDDEQQQAAALAAARKLYRKYEVLPEREARSKLSQALARRGFGWDAIESAIDQLMD